jgi:DNA-binding MarR family transcriptional regulator
MKYDPSYLAVKTINPKEKGDLMSKLNTHSDQIILKVLKQLRGADLKVFLAWFTDSTKFNAPQTQIMERTEHNKSTVSNAFKSLIKKGILEEVKKTKRSIDYKMTDSFLKSVSASDPVPISELKSKQVLDNSLRNSRVEKIITNYQGTDMANEDKYYFKVKADHEHNKTFLKKECASDITSYLVGAGMNEVQIEYYLNRYIKEVTSAINNIPGKAVIAKENWIKDLKNAAEMALVEYFPAPEAVRALSKAAEDDLEPTTPGQYGMMSAKEYRLQRQHIDSCPLIDWTKINHEPMSIEEMEKMIQELINDL